jgi:cell division septum initiation protein DivIVA
MADIPTLVASLDARLDQLAHEISTLEQARATLQANTVIAAPAVTVGAASRAKRRRRLTPQSTVPAPTVARASKPKGAAPAEGPTAKSVRPRRRSVAEATKRARSGSSLSVEQLQQLLADAALGLSAGAIAQKAGAGYNRVLAQLRQLESDGTVRRTGSRRSTLWLLITDEDRIAQRVAELERLAGVRSQDRTRRRGRARSS